MSRKFFALENAELIAGAGGELTAEDMVAAGEGVEEVAVGPGDHEAGPAHYLRCR